MKKLLLTFILLSLSSFLLAQKITITGKLADAKTQEPLIGAIVRLSQNKQIGTVTDENGNFKLVFNYLKDSLVFEYTGYKTKKVPFTAQAQQVFSLLLEEDTQAIEEITVVPGENPAYAILRKVVKNKSKNDKRRAKFYECDIYNRIEGYVNDNEKGISNLRVMKDMSRAAATIPNLRDSKGKVLIPILASESFSRYYYMGKPEKEREDVKVTNLSGIGLESAEGIGQIFTGGKLNDYNFYRNQMNILDKYFTSPIADGWRLKYDYDLLDSVLVDKDTCYVLNIVPRNRQDLVFEGKMWISKNDYALKKIDVQMTKEANINFIKGLKIRQNSFRSSEGYWLPEKVDFEVEVSEFSEIIPNIYVRTHTQYHNYLLNEARDKSFYDELPLPPNNENKDTSYWNIYRKNDSTLVSKVNVYQIIDSLKTIPSVQRYTTILTILTTGYYEMKGIDLGHYARYYAWNDIEGHRFNIGFRTNRFLSKNFTFKTRVGYGLRDQKGKYFVELSQILSRKLFTKATFSRTEDIEPLIFLNQFDNLPDIFIASNRFFTLSGRKPFFKKENLFSIESSIQPSFTEKLTFRTRQLSPLHGFAYKIPENTGLRTEINTTEVILQTTFRKGGNRIRLLDNSEITIGGGTSPKFTLTTALGLKGFAGGDFNYQQIQLDISKYNARIFGIGHANYFISAGYYFGQVPFPLLRAHLGNNTPFLIEKAFNQMSGFEFVSDHYIALNYAHYFENLIFSRLPLFKKANKFLDWRLVVSLNAVYGGLRQENKDLIADFDLFGNPLPPIQSLNYQMPYVEVGYGIDNILKFFRVDFFHRLTYLNLDTAKPFGIKFSAQIKL
ncbi:DUF5686 and carboxypeptidase-like regulatory domain-containing protein [Raineya orbicola]|uniref:Cna protein B-type domain n=1 Tax=Raineya orbicola TaxID=2016530 RepID=A0A2N3IKB9_9BACT|nr:DUF5686 and carboxypeptidase-like regulatory domain-containing protein [Raineya orbicola]PKQ70785.1 Cna protein B-type domain [Raineya orbicola]